MAEQPFSQQESLKLITEMIQKAKKTFHERGTSSILWGSVIAFCGLFSFARMQWRFDIGFDVWLLTLAAFIPQAFISIKERRERTVLTHNQATLNHVWIVYGISIFALVFYFNIVPAVTDKQLLSEGRQLFQRTGAGEEPFHYFPASSGSLLLMLYAIPTFITGLTYRFKPMIIGAVICYAFFIASLFTDTRLDMLFNGLAAVCNWLIPGLLLRRRYRKENSMRNV